MTDRSPSAPDGPTEPDPRVTYANERTMLAWIRTALALMTAGLAITQLLPAFRFAGGRRVRRGRCRFRHCPGATRASLIASIGSRRARSASSRW